MAWEGPLETEEGDMEEEELTGLSVQRDARRGKWGKEVWEMWIESLDLFSWTKSYCFTGVTFNALTPKELVQTSDLGSFFQFLDLSPLGLLLLFSALKVTQYLPPF